MQRIDTDALQTDGIYEEASTLWAEESQPAVPDGYRILRLVWG